MLKVYQLADQSDYTSNSVKVQKCGIGQRWANRRIVFRHKPMHTKNLVLTAILLATREEMDYSIGYLSINNRIGYLIHL